jgi:hypothetical protein
MASKVARISLVGSMQIVLKVSKNPSQLISQSFPRSFTRTTLTSWALSWTIPFPFRACEWHSRQELGRDAGSAHRELNARHAGHGRSTCCSWPILDLPYSFRAVLISWECRGVAESPRPYASLAPPARRCSNLFEIKKNSARSFWQHAIIYRARQISPSVDFLSSLSCCLVASQ